MVWLIDYSLDATLSEYNQQVIYNSTLYYIELTFLNEIHNYNKSLLYGKGIGGKIRW